jgi:hypothetical protein
MIQYQLKLRLNTQQEKTLKEWLCMLTGVWNWAVLKIGRDAADKIYYSPREFQNLLANHGQKMGVPSHTLQGLLSLAHWAWQRCFKKLAKKPRLKGIRNRLNSIPFPDPIKAPKGNHIAVPGLGSVRFHRMKLPEGNPRLLGLGRFKFDLADIGRRGLGRSCLTRANGQGVWHCFSR